MNISSFCRIIIGAMALAILPAVALADLPTVALDNTEIYERSLKALTILLVAAILIENALAVLFNWRVFLTYFSLRGVKTIISVIVSYLIVTSFDLDVVASLLNAYTTEPADSTIASKLLTAMILSGGSGGVNSLMASLGYRERNRESVVNPAAPKSEAWIAIKINRVNAVGPIQVHVTEIPEPKKDPSAIAGTIGVKRPSLKELILRNANRFPANGGHVVDPKKVYGIKVVAHDAGGTLLNDPLAGEEYRFAPRAIIDFEVTM